MKEGMEREGRRKYQELNVSKSFLATEIVIKQNNIIQKPRKQKT